MPGLSPPSARRLARRRVGNPRTVLGLLLVALSVVVGGRAFAAMDDTVEVWSMREAAPSGSTVTADDLTVTRIRFTDESVAEQYWPADGPPPAGDVLVHDVESGDLLARSALTAGGPPRHGELPLAVALGSLPPDLAPGERVDVWVAPETPGRSTAVPVLTDVVVLAVDTRSATGLTGEAQVLVGLDSSQTADIGGTIARAATGSVVLVRRPAAP